MTFEHFAYTTSGYFGCRTMDYLFGKAILYPGWMAVIAGMIMVGLPLIAALVKSRSRSSMEPANGSHRKKTEASQA